MGAHILLPLAVNSKSEQRADSLSPLGFKPATFRMLAHLSDHSAKSHPHEECAIFITSVFTIIAQHYLPEGYFTGLVYLYSMK
jgi:hypothetical protein